MPAKNVGTNVDTITYQNAKRIVIPTAELQSLMNTVERVNKTSTYSLRNRDLDPQLVWQGKYDLEQDDLVVQVPPLFIQEKIYPKLLIDDLARLTRQSKKIEPNFEPDLFEFNEVFNGLSDSSLRTEFYRHEQNWSNRMILGDALHVMGSLAEREGLRGKVQCVYMDPPYGIKFNSNFQWSTNSKTVNDSSRIHISREPEQIKAFRDTWKYGVHSYLSYLRDRMTVARDLLADTGSIFVQIGEDNVHRVRAIMDEVYGEENFVNLITVRTSSGTTQNRLKRISDYIIWYAKKYR